MSSFRGKQYTSDRSSSRLPPTYLSNYLFCLMVDQTDWVPRDPQNLGKIMMSDGHNSDLQLLFGRITL